MRTTDRQTEGYTDLLSVVPILNAHPAKARNGAPFVLQTQSLNALVISALVSPSRPLNTPVFSPSVSLHETSKPRTADRVLLNTNPLFCALIVFLKK
jgi:hypothetical protein